MNKLLKQAFTLIELLVVIAIIGILSGLIVVSMGGMTDKATIAKAQIFSNSLKNSLMMNIQAQYTFDDITDYNPTTKAMNSTSGNVPDSWSANEGQAYGGLILKDGSSCVSGKCLSFDGVDDYVDFGNGSNINMTDKITISAWIKTLDNTKNQIIIGKDNLSTIWYGYRLDIGGGNSLRWFTWTASNPPSLSYNFYFDKWTFVVASYDKSIGRKIYINGSMVNSDSITGDIGISSSSLILSMNYAPASFNGLMDEVRVYNTVISASQIKEQYYAGLNSLLANGNISSEEYLSRINNYASNN